MTHYERASKYVTKKLGKHFAKQHIRSLEAQFREVAEEVMEECAQIAAARYKYISEKTGIKIISGEAK